MWQAISDILTSSNAHIVLIALAALTAMVGILAKAGILQVRRKGIAIGKGFKDAAAFERLILRKQVDYARRFVASHENDVKRLLKENSSPKASDQYFIKYLLAQVTNEVEVWIMLNNIRGTPDYIKMRQLEVSALLHSRLTDFDYDKGRLEAKTDALVQDLIRHLMIIRESSGLKE